jgi:peptidoglycan/xylan/chitin deacetylase (PgdA/CDA1 family)
MIICFHEIKKPCTFAKTIEKLSTNFSLVPLKNYNNQKKTVSLTFDDNYKSWTEAVDILHHYSVPAHFFINTCIYTARLSKFEYTTRLERKIANEFLSIDELTYIDSHKNIRISSHTNHHIRLSENSSQECIDDIQTSLKFISQLRSHDLLSLSYPFGRLKDYYNASLPYILQTCGIKNAYTAIRLNHPLHRLIFRSAKKNLFQPRFIWEADLSYNSNKMKSSLHYIAKDLILPY